MKKDFGWLIIETIGQLSLKRVFGYAIFFSFGWYLGSIFLEWWWQR
jgi:hypothetical protein